MEDRLQKSLWVNSPRVRPQQRRIPVRILLRPRVGHQNQRCPTSNTSNLCMRRDDDGLFPNCRNRHRLVLKPTLSSRPAKKCVSTRPQPCHGRPPSAQAARVNPCCQDPPRTLSAKESVAGANAGRCKVLGSTRFILPAKNCMLLPA